MFQCFQYVFGKKIIVIIDCFEVFIEKLFNLLVRVQIFLSYKNYNIIKVLVGIILQGIIFYVLEVWGGCVLDKFLIENCGFLENFILGDMVMVDRGFIIIEFVGLR